MAVVAEVDWAELANAYGSAEHTPTALGAWLSQDARRMDEVAQTDTIYRVIVDYPSSTVAEAALGWIVVENFHQGSLYPASAPTCRMLIAALGASPIAAVQRDALRVLSHALGTDDNRRDWRGESLERSSFEPHVDVYDEIAVGYELYLQAIEQDRHAEVRRHAARLLIGMDDKDTSAEHIVRVLAEDPGDDEATMAALVRTLGLVVRGTAFEDDAEEQIRWFLGDPTDPGVEAALALARLGRLEEDDVDAIDVLESALAAQGVFSDIADTLLDGLINVALHCAPRWRPDVAPEDAAKRILVEYHQDHAPRAVEAASRMSGVLKAQFARSQRLQFEERIRDIARHHGLA